MNVINITEEKLSEFLREMWFAGWYTSKYTPSPSGDANCAVREAIKELRKQKEVE